MEFPSPFLPKIYYLYPQGTPATALDATLRRCAMMGFDHVLVPQHAFEDSDGDARRNALLRACAAQNLRLLSDIEVPAAVSALPVPDDAIDDLPDPRRPLSQASSPALRAMTTPTQAPSDPLEQFLPHLQRLLQAGIAGFRCLGLTRLPASTWQSVIASLRQSHPAARFLAWTTGCTPTQLARLRDCGFDSTFSSDPWWDYRDRWLLEEQARLLQVAPPIACIDSPDQGALRAVAGYEAPETRLLLYRRALQWAACSGNGVLMPMGFEFGQAHGVDATADPAGNSGAGHDTAAFDLSTEITHALSWIDTSGKKFHAAPLRLLGRHGDSASALLRLPTNADGTDAEALLIGVNASLDHAVSLDDCLLLQRSDGYVRHTRIWPADAAGAANAQSLTLAPGALQLFSARREAVVVSPLSRSKLATTTTSRAPRIVIDAITPTVDDGRFPVKRCVGACVEVETDVFMDGHEQLAVALLWRAADSSAWQEIRMQPLSNDRWHATLPLARMGRYLFVIEAWRDAFATYRDELEKKSAAGLELALELEEGRLMVEAAASYAHDKQQADTAATLETLARLLQSPGARSKGKTAASSAERVNALLAPSTAAAMRHADTRPFAVRSEPALRIDAERSAAMFSSWYELFPRSQSGDPQRHGTFADVETRLPAIQAMGFDTLYFTPIHPIGRKNRKGRNNSLSAAPGEPGSPYAIGAEEGGHDAIHPELGSLQDFRHLRDAAAAHGLELALDFAIQCAPDHPWLAQHPDWFAWRPDGSIRYAENPPKKYQDIVNVDFYASGAIPGLWQGLRDVVLHWVKEGVRVFRVDNPHTKPLPFWEWMITDIRSRYPDTIFLSEAFTRPKMMYQLAKVGFSQSYTYFTWRHSKTEFTAYLTELTTTPAREYFRPHFFVNTPDINPEFLQRSGRPGFLIRAALATTLSGLWGMYSGFELCEATPIPGKEEYLDSEKYQIRAWDWERPGHIIDEITALNRLRQQNPALQSHLGVQFLPASSDDVLYFMKATAATAPNALVGDNVLLVAINLDPFAAHATDIELPLWAFGLPDDATLAVEDLLGGGHFLWHGKQQHLTLDAFTLPYAIWRIRPQGVPS